MTYASTIAPVNGKHPRTGDRFLHASEGVCFGALYHYFEG